MIKKLTSQATKQEEFNERTAHYCYCEPYCDWWVGDRYEVRFMVIRVQ